MKKFSDEKMVAMRDMRATIDVDAECGEKVALYAQNILREDKARIAKSGVADERSIEMMVKLVQMGVGAEHALYKSGIATELSQAAENARAELKFADRKRDCLIEGEPVEVKTAREFNDHDGSLNWMLSERALKSVRMAASYCNILLLTSWTQVGPSTYTYMCRYLIDLKTVADNPALFRVYAAAYNNNEASYHFRFEPALARGVCIDIQKFCPSNNS